MIFALLNVIDAIDETTISGAQAQNENGQLPSSLYDMDNTLGAISLFANSEWFSRSIDQVICKTSFNSVHLIKVQLQNLFQVVNLCM